MDLVNSIEWTSPELAHSIGTDLLCFLSLLLLSLPSPFSPSSSLRPLPLLSLPFPCTNQAFYRSQRGRDTKGDSRRLHPCRDNCSLFQISHQVIFIFWNAGFQLLKDSLFWDNDVVLETDFTGAHRTESVQLSSSDKSDNENWALCRHAKAG